MPKVSSNFFGEVDGHAIELFTLENDNGMKAGITTIGGNLVSLFVPDKDGNCDDVVLGYDNAAAYMTNPTYFGANCGRVANRIKNGRFTIDGVEYQIAQNDGTASLHGGNIGWDKKICDVQVCTTESCACLKLSFKSPDGDENYPGNMDVEILYSLTNDNQLKIDYKAVTDKTTPVNMTHHSYFNLAGHKAGTHYAHEMFIDADYYTPVDENLIPTGIAPVAGTFLDFTTPKTMGADMDEAAKDFTSGFDHNFILNKEAGQYKLAASVYEPTTGRKMDVYTDQPAIQFYAGNFLDGLKGKDGSLYEKHHGFCLETQVHPDAVNHPDFPSVVLKPGERYRHSVAYAFGVK
jgi:aldose 1-epimerase